MDHGQTQQVNILAIPIEALPYVIDEASYDIQRAIDKYDSYDTIDDVIDKLKKSEAQLWIGTDDEKIPEIYAITEVHQLNHSKRLVVTLVGGINGKKYIDPFLSKLKDHAKLNHCDHLVCYVRPGWERIGHLKTKGFKKMYSAIKIEV
jgi:hypothetical protein